MYLAHLLLGETQAAISGFEGYYITTLGRVFSYKIQGFKSSRVTLEIEPKKLKPIRSQVGRARRVIWTVSLNAGREGKRNRPIHRLVLETFVGPCPEGLVSCHGDDDSSNNALSNLRWDTQAKNMQDAIRNGKTTRGERNGMTQLTDVQARLIRESPASVAQLAKRFAVSRDTVENLKRGHTFKHVGGTIVYNRY